MPKKVDHESMRAYATNRLYWFGSLSRKELTRLFGVGSDLASRFIGTLRESVPMKASNKSYVLDMQALALQGRMTPQGVSSELFLSELLLFAGGVKDMTLTCGGTVNAWSMDQFRRSVKPEVLREIVLAITEREALEIVYVGMKPGDAARKRTIEPFRLVHASGRWHLDAHCYTAKERRDFVLSRILTTGARHQARFGFLDAELASEVSRGTVDAWYAPHPDLGFDQRQAVSFEFGMDAKSQTIKLSDHPARIFYFERQFVAFTEKECPPVKLLVRTRGPVNTT